MTAAELRAIVCDVPREALGNDVAWTTDPDNAVFFVHGVAGFLPVPVAEHAFIGSMTAWLMRRNVFASKSRFEETYWTIDMNNLNHRLGNYKSLVAALAAACKEAA